MVIRYRSCLVALGLVGALALSPAHAADDLLDSPMYRAPELPMPEIVTVVTGGTDLWLKALARPEAEMKCRAAQAIALARRHGMKGLTSTIDPLLAELERPNQHATVRLAVAQALIALDARKAAPSLLRQAEADGGDMRDLAEPVLARWDYRPARDVWLARLHEPTGSRRGLILAIQGLATLHEGRAADPLRELVLSTGAPVPVRLEAARALGMLRKDGLEADAERLAPDASARGRADRLAAVALLRRHDNPEAIALLQRLARDTESAVAAPAVRRLLEVDPQLVSPRVESLATSPDAVLRSLAVDALRLAPSEPRLGLLADRLDDPEPDVRKNACRSLRALAGKSELRARVIGEAMRVLAGKEWRGQEQATILLTQLDHKPAAGRLVELLTAERPEACVTAAWGLRKLAVTETLPAVVRHVQARQRKLRATAAQADATFGPADLQLAQLNQFLGQQKYQPADAVLQEFIPRMEPPMRQAVCQESRAAAIWALGLLHEGKPPPGLVTALEGRLNDVNSLPREDLRVCRMAAVTLGRMNANQSLPSLRRYCADQKPSMDPIHNACGWAIEQLTGEVMQASVPIEQVQEERFFLAPGG
jgi:HEAT repeat protein